MCDRAGCTTRISFVGITRIIGPFKKRESLCYRHAELAGAVSEYNEFRHQKGIKRVYYASRNRSITNEHGNICDGPVNADHLKAG